jgi:hypothetical protein
VSRPPDHRKVAAAICLREAASDCVVAHGLLVDYGMSTSIGYLLDQAVVLADLAHALSPLTQEDTE